MLRKRKQAEDGSVWLKKASFHLTLLPLVMRLVYTLCKKEESRDLRMPSGEAPPLQSNLLREHQQLLVFYFSTVSLMAVLAMKK